MRHGVCCALCLRTTQTQSHRCAEECGTAQAAKHEEENDEDAATANENEEEAARHATPRHAPCLCVRLLPLLRQDLPDAAQTKAPPGRVMRLVAHWLQDAFEDWDVPCEKCGDRAAPEGNKILLCDGPGPPD